MEKTSFIHPFPFCTKTRHKHIDKNVIKLNLINEFLLLIKIINRKKPLFSRITSTIDFSLSLSFFRAYFPLIFSTIKELITSCSINKLCQNCINHINGSERKPCNNNNVLLQINHIYFTWVNKLDFVHKLLYSSINVYQVISNYYKQLVVQRQHFVNLIIEQKLSFRGEKNILFRDAALFLMHCFSNLLHYT